jgi:predicted nucleic acid-binding protein
VIVVLDANAAIELVLKRALAGRIAGTIGDADYVIAPDLYVADVTNTLWKYTRANLLSLEDANRVLQSAVDMIDRLESSLGLHQEALTLAHRQSHPVYDALYLVLARRNAAMLVTVDSRLRDLAKGLDITVLDLS